MNAAVGWRSSSGQDTIVLLGTFRNDGAYGARMIGGSRMISLVGTLEHRAAKFGTMHSQCALEYEYIPAYTFDCSCSGSELPTCQAKHPPQMVGGPCFGNAMCRSNWLRMISRGSRVISTTVYPIHEGYMYNRWNESRGGLQLAMRIRQVTGYLRSLLLTCSHLYRPR